MLKDGIGRKSPAQIGRPRHRWLKLDRSPANKTDPAMAEIFDDFGNVVAVLKVIPAYGGNGWQAIIEQAGKEAIIETGLSRTKAYYVACHLHHWDGDRPH